MEFVLQGNRVLIEKPETKESPVLLTDNAKAEFERDLMSRWMKLKVFAAGTECTRIKEGDMVYVGKTLEHSEVVIIEDKTLFLLNENSVPIIWK
jgi:co-chaperonin GroES (HSP10)